MGTGNRRTTGAWVSRWSWVWGFCAVWSVAGHAAGSEAGATPVAKAPMLGVADFDIPVWFKTSFLDLPEDSAEAAAQGKRLMAIFHQDGCPYCAKLVNHNFSQRPIVAYLREHFEVVELNMWGSREAIAPDGERVTETELAKRFKVWFTPTVLFLDEQGRVVFRMNGYYPPDKFLAALHYVAERREAGQSFSAYYRPTASSAAAGELRRQEFFSPPPHRLDHGKPVAVLFEQRDCPDCVALHDGPLAKPATRALLRDLQVVQLDRWSGQPLITPDGSALTARAWADRLGIDYLPALVLFDGGQEVIRAEALFKAFHIQSMIDYTVSGDYRREAEFQRYIHARAERIRVSGQAVDLWD